MLDRIWGNGKSSTEQSKGGRRQGNGKRGWKIYRKVRYDENREVFMARHNSCLLLKLPLGNGLRRFLRNLSKFPARVIYSQPDSTSGKPTSISPLSPSIFLIALECNKTTVIRHVVFPS